MRLGLGTPGLVLCALLGAWSGAEARVHGSGLGWRLDRADPPSPRAVPQRGPVVPVRPPLRRQQTPAGPIIYPNLNGTLGAVTAVIVAIGSNWLVYERVTAFVRRLIAGTFNVVRSYSCRLLRFPPTVAVVTMRGVIATEDEMRLGLSHAMLSPEMVRPDLLDGSLATSRTGELINLRRYERTISRAFAIPGVRAVALLLDSPGGSPAQSSLLHRRLKSLRKRYPRVKLLCFVEDAAASGGYYIACAGDEIIADHNSIIGSIGVISRGFGYVSALKRNGMERRVHAAGESKAGLDPYLPMRSKDMRRQRRLLNELHGNFIRAVREGRAGKLDVEAAATLAYNSTSRFWAQPGKKTLAAMVEAGDGLFDGSIYSGEVAHRIGLVDAVGEMNSELRRRYGRFVHLVRVQPEAPFDLSRLLRWLF